MNIQQIQKIAEDKIDLITSTSIEVMELIAKAAWNAAIEAAALEAEKDHGSYCEEVGNEIRKLKK